MRSLDEATARAKLLSDQIFDALESYIQDIQRKHIQPGYDAKFPLNPVLSLYRSLCSEIASIQRMLATPPPPTAGPSPPTSVNPDLQQLGCRALLVPQSSKFASHWLQARELVEVTAVYGDLLDMYLEDDSELPRYHDESKNQSMLDQKQANQLDDNARRQMKRDQRKNETFSDVEERLNAYNRVCATVSQLCEGRLHPDVWEASLEQSLEEAHALVDQLESSEKEKVGVSVASFNSGIRPKDKEIVSMVGRMYRHGGLAQPDQYVNQLYRKETSKIDSHDVSTRHSVG